MNLRNLLFVLSLFILFSVNCTVFAADDLLFIQPFKAKIFSKPAISSEVIGTVESGFQFSSSGKVGSWVKLVYKGKTGFVSSVQTAKTPPLGKAAVQTGDSGPKLGARARTSSSSAVVAGMKGLTYEDRARVTKGERSDFSALDKVDALKITPEELTQFQLEGGKR